MPIPLDDARRILRQLREALAGLIYGDAEGWVESDPAVQPLFIKSVIEGVYALDIYLTDRTVNRQESDAKAAVNILLGHTWIVSLSDGQTLLALRKPTREDQRMVFFQREPSHDVQLRWELIDTEAAQPIEFPVREEML